MKDSGIIKNIDERNIIIEISPHAECHKCGACHGAKKRQIAIPRKPEYEYLRTGDNVEMVIDDSIMMKVYFLMYGLPLVVFVSAIILTYIVSKHPLFSFVSAILLTSVVYLLLGKFTRTREFFLPEIKRSL